MQQEAFVVQALLISVGWVLGLHFLTYNDDLHQNPVLEQRLAVFIAGWLFLATFSGLLCTILRQRLRPFQAHTIVHQKVVIAEEESEVSAERGFTLRLDSNSFSSRPAVWTL